MKKNTILSFIILMILSLSTFFSACQKDDEIFRNYQTTELDVFQSITLDVADSIDDKNIVWRSSDTSVLTVDNGVVECVGVGSATVFATYGEKTQGQTFTVGINEQNAVLDFEETTIVCGCDFTLTARLLSGGNVVKNVDFMYETDTESVASISNDTIHGVSVGTANITVKAIRDGVIYATKTVIFTVGDNSGIYTEQNAYSLYLTENVRGHVFDKVKAINYVVYDQGELVVEPTIHWTSENEQIVSVDNNGVLTANSVGETYVIASYTNKVGNNVTSRVHCKVSIPVVQTTYDFIADKREGITAIPVVEIFGENVAIGTMEVNGKTYDINHNVFSFIDFASGEFDCVLYDENNTYGYLVALHVSDLVVKTVAELVTITDVTTDGYVTLANDLPNAGNVADKTNRCFTGCFNGLGHTISNANFNGTNAGIFWGLENATLKNISIKASTITGNTMGALYYRSKGDVIIDNVFVEVEFAQDVIYQSGGLIGFAYEGSVEISNSIVIATGLQRSEKVSSVCGALVGRASTIVNVQNVYVITDGDLCGKLSHTYNTRYEEINKYAIAYETEADFVEARNKENSDIQFEGFGKYWDLTKDLPTFYAY